MSRKAMLSAVVAVVIGVGMALGAPCTAQACGGMFSPESTIDQNGERVVIVQNGDGTITAIIQNTYEGEAEDFAWLLPVPRGVGPDDIGVVEDGDLLFGELEQMTTPYFVRPEACYAQSFNLFSFFGGVGAGAPPGDGARGLGGGVVGPYNFEIVEADNAAALGDWLNANGYRFTPEMEPFVAPYVEAGNIFLALRLRPGEGVEAIEPVRVTMPGDKPVIPIRMAAVAAAPDTTIVAWFFADSQAVPTNFEHVRIDDNDLRYNIYGDGREFNYGALVDARIDAAGGHAWLVEYAEDTSNSQSFEDQRLAEIAAAHPYLTRLRAKLDPEQMTLDPTFDFDASQPDRPAGHVLSQSPAVVADCQAQQNVHWAGFIVLWCVVPLAVVAIAIGVVVWLVRRRRQAPKAAA